MHRNLIITVCRYRTLIITICRYRTLIITVCRGRTLLLPGFNTVHGPVCTYTEQYVRIRARNLPLYSRVPEIHSYCTGNESSEIPLYSRVPEIDRCSPIPNRKGLVLGLGKIFLSI